MTILWILGLLRHRSLRLIGAGFGIAVTVAFLAALGAFLADSTASMTERATAEVPIDWQVEAVPGADATTLAAAIRNAAPVRELEPVAYAAIAGFQATTRDSVQTTGPGKVVGVGPHYLTGFPKEMRLLSGSPQGVLIAQQTASNLHVGPGDTVSITRIGLDPVTVTVAGVIDMPDADAFFQAVGVLPRTAPQAPPDNALILPQADWHRVFDAQTALRPDTTRQQFHVRLDHRNLSTQPTEAYVQVTGQARNLEAKVAGQALVADTLGARLDAVRGDALYAAVLFLFLGLPGAALSAALTVAISASGAGNRRTEQALLRVRGASIGQITGLAAAEAALVSAGGIAAGLLVFAILAWLGLPNLGSRRSLLITIGAASAAGLVLGLIAVLMPAWRQARAQTVMAQRQPVGRKGTPLWQRLRLDLVLLALAAGFFWQSASTGYEIVLAPEGVAAASVDYKAFLAPALFWLGSALLVVRVVNGTLDTRVLVSRLIGSIAGRLAPVVAASLATQARRITLGVAMTALGVSFGTSTAIFNATYQAQARVDALLTNGADVAVFGTSAYPASLHLAELSGVAGVTAETMQHRFAYVGSDLQDLYGINASTIARVTVLSDAYFSGGTAAQVMAKLATTPDGLLVSQETVTDFQLTLGDTLNLRLLGADHQYRAVPFTFVGVAREFPTAPKDSFLVANADYVARVSGVASAEYVLLRTSRDPAALAATIRATLPGVQVQDISHIAQIIGSSLTAINLTGLSQIELGFAVLMAAAAAGLMQAIGFNDRRRSFAILSAIGAKRAQLRVFLWSEGVLVVGGGSLFGLLSGVITAWMLVKLLTGAFDPPPEGLVFPLGYLTLLLGLVAASVTTAVTLSETRLGKEAVDRLRDF